VKSERSDVLGERQTQTRETHGDAKLSPTEQQQRQYMRQQQQQLVVYPHADRFIVVDVVSGNQSGIF